ncbi:OmpP1/FadL family transporter [Vibrio sp. 10N.261.46.E12]|uniref:OmpP1/FadL family transporter n=1 Tax=unclassified Vibrio TaxID=2614977 RepID=UPI00097866D2|nr:MULTISPECIES: outer membrane protein transport protein [unclassified Vibrio]OMO37657.1 long-chain fatty acid transporter [Vibrio sp. 10N.261.45.E1]PMJ19650.1 long-chain fatty acid transporter [Vibrio sp. 10N.286.45.B6]PML93137.1 long-chain fatty acid transporter [Vibrio sp. 10N.261.49.E11]PMM66598.1 long-chain fatty acid transporter [Vibrio sp. 10N.261.46.F12]PMM86332.1 long-chain fatty acid transporter [Vibrio sp. 10N.261.46.E8]
MKKTALALLVVSNLANASGTLMQESIYANAGAAGAGDGVNTKSAAASWTNPATMSHMGDELMTVNTMIFNLEMEYVDQNDTPKDDLEGNADSQTIMPSGGFFYVRRLNEDIHAGINIAAYSGSAVDYGTHWDASGHLNEAFMSSIQFNPTMSFQFTEQVSVGVGIQANYGLLDIKTDGLETKDMGTDWAFGYNAGILYKEDDWALGLSYRSQIEHDFKDMDIDFNVAGNAVPSLASANSIIPVIVDLSGHYQLNDKVNLLSSIQYHRWSAFDNTEVYQDKLNTKDQLPQGINRDWDDVWKFAIGTEYQFNSDWLLSAGMSYETSPQDDPTKQWVDVPAGEQYRYAMGASTNWGDTRVDLFYEYVDLGDVYMERTESAAVNFQGTMSGSVHFVGANFTF